MIDADIYDEDYFLRGRATGKSLYEDYRWLPDLTVPMARAMVSHLGIQPEDTILDFGCARGYLVRAFREMGYAAWGYDVSRWALENADPVAREFLIADPVALAQKCFYWTIAKDVLEHIPESELQSAVATLRAAQKGTFVVVPLGSGGRYEVPEYDKDVTHIHRRQIEWWLEWFTWPGWAVTAQYRVRGIKDNYRQFSTGNGFITARRISD